MDKTYDVVVIGGGAAGLSGALTLGRARRSVLVADSGSPRNAPAHGVHNYLGQEGVAPRELLATGRREAEQYGVEFSDDTVTHVERAPDGSFTVSLADRQVRARRLLVATGVVDDLPSLPGLSEGWGTSVIHCPYCHGWEVRDQPIGVLATGPLSIHQALLFRQWSDDIVVFSDTRPEPSPQEAEQLRARGIAVVTGPVAGWEGTGMRMADGQFHARQALVVGSPVSVRIDFLDGLGLQMADLEMNGQVFGSHIAADPTGRTSVAGVWAAGNVANPMAQVIASAAAGLMAAAAINGDLMTEETNLAVEAVRLADLT